MARTSTRKQNSRDIKLKKESEQVPSQRTIDNILAFAQSYTPTGLKNVPDKGMILN